MSELLALARPEIRELKPYAHAVWDPALVRLHANEIPWTDETDGAEWRINRYPEPQPKALNAALAAYYGVEPDRLLACRGSDEGIDLLIRAFCRAGQDRVMICPPTFAMYSFAAAVQGAEVVEVPLDANFDLDAQAVLSAWSPGVKIVFLCSPNNPTGNRHAYGCARARAGRSLRPGARRGGRGLHRILGCGERRRAASATRNSWYSGPCRRRTDWPVRAVVSCWRCQPSST